MTERNIEQISKRAGSSDPEPVHAPSIVNKTATMRFAQGNRARRLRCALVCTESRDMKILKHRALRGPNRRSRYQAIFRLMDIGAYEQQPSDTLDGFADQVSQAPDAVSAMNACSP